MNWKAKGVVQKALSTIPGGASCNYLLQRTLGQLRSDSFVTYGLRAGRDSAVRTHVAAGARPGEEPHPGDRQTGWVPTFSLCLALAGFRNTFTVDLHAHLRETAVRRTLMALREHLEHPVFQTVRPPRKRSMRTSSGC